MDRQITIRCTGDDAEALERLQAQLPDLSLAAVARVAMRKGLEAIDGDATKLIRSPSSASSGVDGEGASS